MAAAIPAAPRKVLPLLGAANFHDRIFRGVVVCFGAIALLAIIFVIVGAMVEQSVVSVNTFGLNFIWGQNWDPVKRQFGALPFIYGTVVSSFIALLVATPISIGVAIFAVEMAPPWLGNTISVVVELLAAIPSVLLGLWGIFVMIPFLQTTVEPWFIDRFPNVPLFQGPPYGVGLLAGGLILAIMVTPTIVAISRDVMLAVPISQREAMLALGATNWEATARAVLPYCRSGLLGAIMLGMGRAVGETMAVTMVIGNRADISASLFHPSYTMASVIANEFTEATYDLYVSALVEVGLVLFVVTVLMNAAARLLVWSTAQSSQQLGAL
ncbi:MAG TPA: phosphate ABC transporter permease subunit PstC [Chloroflexota bacterium]|nr:phosphate ABC transporter permease subunit PstC [Chloroflexota bacterium]